MLTVSSGDSTAMPFSSGDILIVTLIESFLNGVAAVSIV